MTVGDASLPKRVDFLKVYRFAIELRSKGVHVETFEGPAVATREGPIVPPLPGFGGKPRTIGLVSIDWSADGNGRDLIFKRGMSSDRVPLVEEIAKVDDVRVVIYDVEAVPRREWRVEHEGVRDRGFDFANAMIDAVALESVALLDAKMVPVPSPWLP